MKISLKWLNDFVDVKEYLERPEPLAEILTKAGLEVEDIQDRGKDFQFVVSGLILDKQKHPDADKLSLCQVTTGDGVVHQIVCGAQNHKANDKVLLALPGAVLPGNLKIGRSVIRGVESGGMLCSLKELGLATESQGIHILPAETPIGKPVAEILGVDDVTFELKVTPNRADCLSHYGLAREVACLLGRTLKRPEPKVKTTSNLPKIQLAVKDTELCPRYAGRWIANVKVGESPMWLKQRLESIGLKSINNIVDVTNFVMMELGQPLHAFDAKDLLGHKIVVEKSQPGEIFATLDGTNLKLTGDELVIRDAERAVALAGVVGGKNSGVSAATADIFLESAFFDPASVRRTSRRFGVVTDSAYRFSRGVDPEGTRLALERATELILQVAGGNAADEVHDFYPKPVKKKTVATNIKVIGDRLGYPCDAKLFQDWMNRLGCDVQSAAAGEFSVQPPTFRFDLEVEMDLVEEYARLTGYDQIPETFPTLRKEPGVSDSQWNVQGEVGRVLRGQGFSQAINFAFASDKEQSAFIKNDELMTKAGFQVSGTTVTLRNPLSDDINVMRKTLSLGLFKNAIHNFHQGQEFGALFEVGACFDTHLEKDVRSYREETRIAALCWGHASSLWNPAKKGFEPFRIKAALQALFAGFALPTPELIQPENRGEIPSFLHRGQAAWVKSSGASVGYIGSLHPRLLDEHKIRVPVALFELSLKPFAQAKPLFQHYKAFSRFPAVSRDLSLLMPQRLTAAQVIGEMQRAGGELLKSAEVFDVYNDESLGKGTRSVSFRLAFQAANGTLQDQMVQEKMGQILDSLKQKWGLTPR